MKKNTSFPRQKCKAILYPTPSCEFWSWSKARPTPRVTPRALQFCKLSAPRVFFSWSKRSVLWFSLPPDHDVGVLTPRGLCLALVWHSLASTAPTKSFGCSLRRELNPPDACVFTRLKNYLRSVNERGRESYSKKLEKQ